MQAEVFARLRALVHEQSGIVLGEGKEALAEVRLSRRMRALEVDDAKEYLRILESDQTGQEMTLLLDAMSTNVTHFFRESEHFDVLQQLAGTWLAAGQRRMRMWCAAASSGEEPYTIAMVLHRLIGAQPVDFKLLATDISTTVLTQALSGRYSKKSLDSIPAEYRDYIRNGPDHIQMHPALQALIRFARFNLIDFPYPFSGPMDIIFCRNVMIYFDENHRRQIVGEFTRLLKPGGVLMVGHSEGLVGVSGALRMIRPSVYQKVAP